MRSYIPVYVCLILAASPALSAPLWPPTSTNPNDAMPPLYRIGVANLPQPPGTQPGEVGPSPGGRPLPGGGSLPGGGPFPGGRPLDLTTILPRDPPTPPGNNVEPQDEWAALLTKIKERSNILDRDTPSFEELLSAALLSH